MIDNKLSSHDLKNLPDFPELQSLSLGGNKIDKISDLEPLKKYSEIAELDFLGCNITNEENYRSELFKMFPTLLVIFTYFFTVSN